MPQIELLSQDTIDKIAAGEVVERPSSVVKELVENAIDAKATAITVEIKEGGISFIRITDNGCGIEKNQVRLAFLRHSTSKIKTVEDLMCVKSLGFRGEALSSISAVSRVELITKTYNDLTGSRYVIEGSKELILEEVGAPEGTTFIIKDLFYNTPARRKFLKSPQTEGTYISDIVEKLALSHPDISFKFINNNQVKLHTSGNDNKKDLIYHIFGRDISASLLEINHECDYFKVTGFIGKPIVNRGNRNYENYFINGRYIKSSLLARAIEEAYKNFLMQHQYPFTCLYFNFFDESLDVNVHPTKMELRFGNNQEVYKELCDVIFGKLSGRDLIPEVSVDKDNSPEKLVHKYTKPIPEPFEKRRINDIRDAVSKDSPYEIKYPERAREPQMKFRENTGSEKGSVISKTLVSRDIVSSSSHETTYTVASQTTDTVSSQKSDSELTNNSEIINNTDSTNNAKLTNDTVIPNDKYEEITLEQLSPDFMTEDAKKKHKIIGQLFNTYWLIEYEEKLYIIDQHAAHEKVLFEKTMKSLKNKEFTSQSISPPIVLTLDAREQEALEKYRTEIETLGYSVEAFGGKEYMINALPANLYSINMKDLFIEMLDDFTKISGRETPDLILEKVASMSCKAAVKGNDKLSRAEIESLIDELLSLDNPYNCPHGRPTIISMTKYEIEKKFKRII